MSDPIVGTIFRSPNSPYPAFTQPGGPGTATLPAQPPQPYENVEGLPPNVVPIPYQEQAARFNPGCGHAIQSWEIKCAGVGGVPSAILCCPRCGWVQAIYTPYASIFDQDFIFG